MKNPNTRRLIIISNMYPSDTNVRYGIFVKRFKDALSERFHIKLIVISKKSAFIDKLIAYLVLYLKVLWLLFTTGKSNIVYVHYPLYFAPLLSPFIWKSIPLVLNFHGSDIVFDSYLKRVLSFWLFQVARRCNKIVVPSMYYKNKVAKLFDIPDDHIFVYPSGGVDNRIFRPRPKKESGFVLGYVSNFIRKKGWRIFLEAIHILKENKEFPSFDVIMIGDGPDRNKILETINFWELEVKIIHSVDQTKLAEYYSQFDVFVFPTYREEESLGLVGLEAMMCGIPVIATKIGGPMGYIRDGYNGFLFEREDSLDLANKIMRFRKLSPRQKKIMQCNCIETASEYEQQKVKNDLVNLLDRL